MYSRGENPEKLEDLKDAMERPGMREYEKFINDKTRYKPNELIIETYEDILTYNRKKEKDALNETRFIVYEKNRPPQDKWYEMKSSGFQKELYRNRVALKPNNTNAVYLENLLDNKLY